MANPSGRRVGGGTITPVYVMGGEDGSLEVGGTVAIDGTVTADPTPVLSLAANVAEPGADAAAIVTRAAGAAGVANILGQIAWSLSEAPAAAVNLAVEDGAGTTIFSVDVTAAGPGSIQFSPPMRGTAATTMVITLAAGGGAVIGKVSVHAWTE